MEREIIKSLQESRNQNRLLEARRGPIEVFFAQLTGTRERLRKANAQDNSPNQQKAVQELALKHLDFLYDNMMDIQTILITPEGQKTNVVRRQLFFEGKVHKLDEASKDSIMFFKELDELLDRAKKVQSVNDREQKLEFQSIVIARIEEIKSKESILTTIMDAPFDEEFDMKGNPLSISKDLGLPVIGDNDQVAWWKAKYEGEIVKTPLPTTAYDIWEDQVKEADFIVQGKTYPVYGRTADNRFILIKHGGTHQYGWMLMYSDTVGGLYIPETDTRGKKAVPQLPIVDEDVRNKR